jgi:hypothetical protein
LLYLSDTYTVLNRSKHAFKTIFGDNSVAFVQEQHLNFLGDNK